MKIAPTLKGGLRIDVESLLDWARLELIAIDGAKLDGNLPVQLGREMDIDEDWQNYVIPDLSTQFSEQLQFIQKEIRTARSNNSNIGEIHITPENVGLWYGAINQARLFLENEFQLSQYESPLFEAPEDLDQEIQAALIKSHFYSVLQMNLLDHVMQ